LQKTTHLTLHWGAKDSTALHAGQRYDRIIVRSLQPGRTRAPTWPNITR